MYNQVGIYSLVTQGLSVHVLISMFIYIYQYIKGTLTFASNCSLKLHLSILSILSCFKGHLLLEGELKGRQVLVAQLCLTLQPHRLQPARLLCPWDSPVKNTGVGCHFLLQGIFQIQGWNPGLLHCRQILQRLSHHGKPQF